MGVRFPLPAPSIPFVCNDLRVGKRPTRVRPGTNTSTVRNLFILNNLGYLVRLRPFARLRLAGIRLR
jgi:hypothetical protein